MYTLLNKQDTIYGLKTVNCGEVVQFNNSDPMNPMRPLIVEVLRPEKHNPNAEIMCYYFWDANKPVKIEITIYRLRDNTYGCEIYYFKTKDAIHHYRSSNHVGFKEVPIKYTLLLKHLKPYFTEIFG